MCIYSNSYAIYTVSLHALNYPLNKSHLIESLRVHSHCIRCHNGRSRMTLWKNVLIVEWASMLLLTMAFAIGPVKAGHFSIKQWLSDYDSSRSLPWRRECSENKFVALCTFYSTHQDFKRDYCQASLNKKWISDSHDGTNTSLLLSVYVRLNKDLNICVSNVYTYIIFIVHFILH